jgi:hypothetical protein
MRGRTGATFRPPGLGEPMRRMERGSAVPARRRSTAGSAPASFGPHRLFRRISRRFSPFSMPRAAKRPETGGGGPSPRPFGWYRPGPHCPAFSRRPGPLSVHIGSFGAFPVVFRHFLCREPLTAPKEGTGGRPTQADSGRLRPPGRRRWPAPPPSTRLRSRPRNGPTARRDPGTARETSPRGGSAAARAQPK